MLREKKVLEILNKKLTSHIKIWWRKTNPILVDIIFESESYHNHFITLGFPIRCCFCFLFGHTTPSFFASAFPSACSNKTAWTKSLVQKIDRRLVNYANPLWLYQGVSLANQQPPKSTSVRIAHTDEMFPWHEEIHPREIQNFPLIGQRSRTNLANNKAVKYPERYLNYQNSAISATTKHAGWSLYSLTPRNHNL